MKSYANYIKANYQEMYRQLKQDSKWNQIAESMGTVWYFAKKYCKDCNDLEDLLSIGMIGILKALPTYLPQNNVRFSTYASKCIENEIQMYLRRNLKQKREVYIEEWEQFSNRSGQKRNGNVNGMIDVHHLYESYPEYEQREQIRSAMKRLLPVEKQILMLRYGYISAEKSEEEQMELYSREIYTQKEAAQMLGCSQSYVSRIEKKALEHMRRHL